MLYAVAISLGLLAAHAQTRDDCPDESIDNVPLVPFIDVDESGFTGGNLVVALAFDHRINYSTCFMKGRAEDNRWFKNDGLTADDVCDDMYANDYTWNALREVLVLKDISDDDLPAGDNPDKYRYEGVVVCKYTEDFRQADLDLPFTRNSEHEMDFFINIPDTVNAEVAMTQRLSQPTEQVDCTSYYWMILAANFDEGNVARAQEVLNGVAVVSSQTNGAFVTVTATPIATARFTDTATNGGLRGQFDVEEITEDHRNTIDPFMLFNGVPLDTTCTVIYFIPEAVITSTVSDAYRDTLDVTITVTTAIESPWYFAETAAVDTNTDIDAPITITRASDCAPLDDQCYQEWTIELKADNFCGIVEDVPITITYTPLVQANVQSTDWNDNVDTINVTLAVLADAFQCSLELAENEITASAELVIYKDDQFDSVEGNTKSAWRTSETPHFRATVTTTQALLIESTTLVTLDLTQGTAVTNIVRDKAPVVPIDEAAGRQGRQDITTSPYTQLAGSATTVEFSVNLDLDLFQPFENLDPVSITWSVLIEITYEDLYTPADNGRRRRRLVTADAPGRPKLGATASKNSWMFPSEEDLKVEIIVKTDARTEESESEDVAEENSNIIIYVLAGVVVMALGVAVYVLKMVRSIKKENIRAELNVHTYKQAGTKDII